MEPSVFGVSGVGDAPCALFTLDSGRHARDDDSRQQLAESNKDHNRIVPFTKLLTISTAAISTAGIATIRNELRQVWQKVNKPDQAQREAKQ